MLALLPRPLHSTPTALPILQCRHGLALQEMLSSASDAPVGMRTVPVARSYALPACNLQRQWQNQYSRGQRQAASAAKQNSSPQHGNSRPSMYNNSRNWDQLVGWEVLLQRNGFFIGTVQEVRNHHLTDKLHPKTPDFLHQHSCHSYSTHRNWCYCRHRCTHHHHILTFLTLDKGNKTLAVHPPSETCRTRDAEIELRIIIEEFIHKVTTSLAHCNPAVAFDHAIPVNSPPLCKYLPSLHISDSPLHFSDSTPLSLLAGTPARR